MRNNLLDATQSRASYFRSGERSCPFIHGASDHSSCIC